MLPAPTQSNILAALRSFLVQVLPRPGRTASRSTSSSRRPTASRSRQGDSFVTMTPTRFERIETNFDSYEDASFTGSIAGTTLTITAVDPRFPDGALEIGTTIFGVGVADGTVVSEILTGTGRSGPTRSLRRRLYRAERSRPASRGSSRRPRRRSSSTSIPPTPARPTWRRP
jgi:hypothetical protein